MFDGRHLCDLESRAARLPATSKLALRRGAEDVLDDALERYALLVAADSLGIMRTLVALSARHLDERVQFGQKIGNFQALQHRLVDMQLRLVRAESLVESAYMLAEAAAGNAAAAIAAARVGCEDAGIFIAEHAVQLHEAMGMTNEFIVGHYLKRLTANRFVAGDRAEHFARFGALRD
jgi:alkylation response protein AidB-like acyl-CoA dehydrogenase